MAKITRRRLFNLLAAVPFVRRVAPTSELDRWFVWQQMEAFYAPGRARLAQFKAPRYVPISDRAYKPGDTFTITIPSRYLNP